MLRFFTACALLAVLLTSGGASAQTRMGLVIHSPSPLPPLDIRDGQDRPAGLEALKGKPVLLNLWASWCVPCVAELPSLDRLKPKAEAKGIAVVALSLDRGGKSVAAGTFARLGIANLDLRVDGARDAGQKLSVAALPLTLLLDRDGREIGRFIGAAEWDGPESLALMDALAADRPLSPAMEPRPARIRVMR